MSLTKKQKKAIQELIGKKSISDISKEIGATQKSVYKYIEKTQRLKKSRNKSQKDTKNLKNDGKKQAIQQTIKIINFETFKNFHKKYIDFIILAIILTFIVFLNSLKGNFVSDDISGIIQNPQILSGSVNLSKDALNTILHFSLYSLFGENPIPFHVLSLIFHLFNVYLVFLLLGQIFEKKKAMLATLFFALHPVVTETVDWISAINYLLNTFVILVTLNLTLIYKYSKNKMYLNISYIFFGIMVLLTRNPWLTTSFPIIVIFDQLIFEQKIKFSIEKIKIYIPFLLVLVLYVLLFMLPGYSQRLTNLTNEYQFSQENKTSLAYSIPYTIAKSSFLYVLPIGLTLYHEGEPISNTQMVVMTVFSIALVVSAFAMYKKNKVYSAMVFVFLVSIAPALSPVQIAWFVAERYLYFGTIAFGIVLAGALIYLENKFKIKNASILFALIILLLYSIKTIQRNAQWRTHKSLWEATAQVSPYSKRVYNNLGDVYSKEGDKQKAIQMFQKAIELDPNYNHAYHNLANTYLEVGDVQNAITNFEKSIQVDPNLYQSYYKLGLIYFNQKEYDKATQYFQETLKISPNYEPAIYAYQVTQQTIQQQQKLLNQEEN